MRLLLAALLVLWLSRVQVVGAPVEIRLNPSARSPAKISAQLFGSYQEEHWGDITPGVYEQYLVNPSFEPWYRAPKENKTRLVFEGPGHEGVAYPWEPLGEAGRVGWEAANERVNSAQAQRVDVADEVGGVAQRLALPDDRVRKYRLRVHVRTQGSVRAKAQLLTGAAEIEVLDERPLGAGTRWQAVEVELELKGRLTERHLGRYGVARLALVVEGNGSAWFDQASLFPNDAVDGIWNPETLAHLARVRPTAVRWPGGNFTSGYNWRDGIGPIDARPSRPNLAWGGTEPNHVGTDEWLQFCEKSGMEPVMGVGFGLLSAQDAADWVEYCNGDAQTTKLGALRAANGRSKPYGVKVWGLGNEVYGDYQIGHTDAATYARGFVEMARAMKARDPSIQVVAVGLGVHNDFRGQHPDWNRTVLEIAGPHIDLLDVHYYVYGPNAREMGRLDANTVRRALLGSEARVEAYYQSLRGLIAARPETRQIKLVHYEWAVLPRVAALGFARQTWHNALATAAQYHAFFRNGDLVHGAMLHNFSFYVQPVAGHAEPPNPRTHVSQLYREIAAGGRVMPLTVEGPRYDVPQNVPEIGPLRGVAVVDAVAWLDPRGALHVSLLNRDLVATHDAVVRLADRPPPGPVVTWRRLDSERPGEAVRWDRPAAGGGVRETTGTSARRDDGAITLRLPPASITLLEVPAP